MNIVLLGAPGAGKGTIAQFLAQNYDFVQLSTGDALREEVKAGTTLGKKVEPIMKSGALVSDELIAEVLESRLKKIPIKKSVILDGYPRTLKQAELLEKILKNAKRKLDFVLNVKVDDDVVIKRLTARRQCKNCNTIYGLDNPPKKEGICDKCGGELFLRPDDEEETVRKRLATYKEKTMPLIDYYKKKALLKEINGNAPLKEVFEEVKKLVKNR